MDVAAPGCSSRWGIQTSQSQIERHLGAVAGSAVRVDVAAPVLAQERIVALTQHPTEFVDASLSVLVGKNGILIFKEYEKFELNVLKF